MPAVSSDPASGPRFFYGWWIVAAAASASLINSVSTFYGFGAFFLPIQREFNTSRAALAAVISGARIQGSLLGPLEGWLVDHYGPRIMMLIGMFVMGVGFVVISVAHSLWMFYGAFIFGIALGASLGAGTPGSVAVANWFRKKRSTAFGLTNAGFAVGTILVPVVGWLVVSFGWRGAAMLMGFAIWILGIPLALVMRHRPEDYGYLPDGAAPSTQTENSALAVGQVGSTETAEESNFTPKEAMLSSAFWLLGFTFVFRTLTTNAVNVHQIPFLLDQGFSITQATMSVSVVGIASLTGRIVLGWMGDRIEKRYALAGSLAAMAIGMFILASSTSMSQIYLFGIIYGTGFGGTAPLMGALRADYFGRQNFGTIGGFMSMLTLIGAASGPAFAGLAYDRTGSYRGAFTLIAFAALIGMGCILAARPPKVRQAKATL